MTIEFDRRHVFYLDAEGNPHTFCPYRLDRLWRGEPDTTEPSLADHRIRFALFHVERFTSPPRVIVEHYPIIPFDAHGRNPFTHRYLIAATRAQAHISVQLPVSRAHRSAA